MLFQLVFHVSKCELGAPDRHVQFAQNPGQGSDVVFVTMRENNGANALAVLNQIGNFRNNNIDAEKFGLGKHQARVNDDDVVAPAHGHAVHSELAQAAQGDNVQFSSWHAEY